MARSWIDTKTLLASGLAKLFAEAAADKTMVMAGNPDAPPVPQAPGAALPIPGDPGQPAVGSPVPQPQAQAAQAQVAAQPPPQSPKFAAVPRMTEIPHDEPSLASRTRPDLPSPDVRHKNFVASYSDPKAMNKSLRRLNNNSLNVVFHGDLGNGSGYIAKPHEGIGHRDRFHPNEQHRLDDATFNQLKGEAPDNARRHNATYDLMAAMGAHHMVTPGMQANMHQRHQFKGADPDEFDSDEKRLTMASHHAGGLAHVQEFVPDALPVSKATAEQLAKVDHEHRLHGMVSHLLFGNGDGNTNNVMLDKSGHPVLIDHDITLGSSQAQAYKQHFGKDAIRSVFAPGGPLDYQATLPKDDTGQVIPVGTNYPPRMKEVLQRAAEGYYDQGPGALDLSPADRAALQLNARQLMTHGLEGTLSRRHDIDAEARAKKAAKAARGGKK